MNREFLPDVGDLIETHSTYTGGTHRIRVEKVGVSFIDGRDVETGRRYRASRPTAKKRLIEESTEHEIIALHGSPRLEGHTATHRIVERRR